MRRSRAHPGGNVCEEPRSHPKAGAGDHVSGASPAPVTLRAAGHVHAGLVPRSSTSWSGAMASAAADDQARRISSQATPRSARGIAPGSSRRSAVAASGRVRVPAPRRVVVVRAGVDDAVGAVGVRQERVVGGSRRRRTGAPASPGGGSRRGAADVGRDDAQVLGDERQAAQLGAGRPEEILPGPGTHWPSRAVGCPGRDVPGGGEAAEVVEPDDVHLRQHGAQAGDPPAIARPAERLPVVERVAPELALGAEVVGRHAGDDRGRRCSSSRNSSGWPTRPPSRGRRRTAGRR